MEQAQSPDAIRSPKHLSAKALAAVLLATTIASSAGACSGVGPPGKPVVFGDQTNIVVWDEKHGIEHFIRNASFKSGAENFGFIAPTPGKPELHEASTQAFFTLANLAPVFATGGVGGGGFGGTKSRSSEVQVIQEADVSGYHATTLFSKSSQAINDWMNEHGYVSTPEVEKWARRYCSWGWYLTAFKVVDKAKLAASTGTIRMTFKTEKPYNPFYVPATNIPNRGKGTLRVYFVATGDYDANIGIVGPWKTPQWTSAIPDATAELLAKQIELPKGSIPDKAQVETFVDNDFPRPAADDIYFVKRKPPVKQEPEPTVPRTPPPYWVGLLLAPGLMAIAKRRKLG